jgi:hypothetical protein
MMGGVKLDQSSEWESSVHDKALIHRAMKYDGAAREFRRVIRGPGFCPGPRIIITGCCYRCG